MAFPFFKKTDEKMPAKPAVKPRAATAPASPTQTSTSPVEAADDGLEDLDFTGIQVVEEIDPLAGAIEHAAVGFANDDDEGAASALRDAIAQGDHSPTAERLWLMLFDLYLVSGQREKFAALEMVYARHFEKQPPSWHDCSSAALSRPKATGATAFPGDLLASNSAGFAQLKQLIADNPKARLDLSKVTAADAGGCELFLACMQDARKKKRCPEVSGCDVLVSLLEPKIQTGDPETAYWRMLLECHQLRGHEEEFENLAVEFAVTFEISPPSWEVPAATTKAVAAAKAAETAASAKARDDAFYLNGEIRGGRFDGLDAWLCEHEQSVVDMTEVTRLDFASAGTLLNILAPHRQRGVVITLRHPNHLVAELLGLMGVDDMATIVYSKR